MQEHKNMQKANRNRKSGVESFGSKFVPSTFTVYQQMEAHKIAKFAVTEEMMIIKFKKQSHATKHQATAVKLRQWYQLHLT
jgi:hypothetical protein